MKFYFILFVCIFLFKSNNHPPNREWPCSVQTVYTIIEDKVSKKDTHWLRLFDVVGTKRCVLKNIFECLDSAYRLAIPLEFTFHQENILRIRVLDNGQKSKYLSTFCNIQFYEGSQLAPNLNTRQLYSVANNKAFYHYLAQHFERLNLKNLNVGCEARAGIIANYLSEHSNLSHYKIFINGQLKLRTEHAAYAWAHHVLNLIPLKEKGLIHYYVFDPFILGHLYTFDTFLEQLRSSGSGDINYRVTDANVFVCLMQKPIGICDKKNCYSKIIFQQLYQY